MRPRKHKRECGGHVLRHESGEPSFLGECEKCGLTNVQEGDPCTEDGDQFTERRGDDIGL